MYSLIYSLSPIKQVIFFINPFLFLIHLIFITTQIFIQRIFLLSSTIIFYAFNLFNFNILYFIFIFSMNFILFIYTILQVLIKHMSGMHFPDTFIANQTIFIPDSYSWGFGMCKQVEITETRVYCLSEGNAISSWFKNTTGLAQNIQFDIIPFDQYIHQFTVSSDETEIIFALNLSPSFYILSAQNLNILQVKNVGNISLTSIVKTNSKYVFTYCGPPFSTYQLVQFASLTFSNLSSTLLLDMEGPVKIKVNAFQNVAIVWNAIGQFCLIDLNGQFPVYFNCVLTSISSTVLTQTIPTFSPDGSRLILQYDDCNDLFVIGISANSTVYIKNLTIYETVYKIEFVDNNSKIILFRNSNVISYYEVDTMTELYTVDVGSEFSIFLKIDILNRRIFNCFVNMITIFQLNCPLGMEMASLNSFECTLIPNQINQTANNSLNQTNSTNILIIIPSTNTTNITNNITSNITIPLSNNTSANNTTILNTTTNNNSIIYIKNINQNQTIYISPQTQILFSFSSNTLSSQCFRLVNSIPGSRRLLRPLFVFFTNFDDLWLYNYIDISFNPVMQNLFNTIQSLQQQKWNIIPFQTIWSQWFGLDIEQNITLVNNYIRNYATSPKFYTIENRQNGYIGNTLQFFMSSIILMILIFLAGFLLFKIASHFDWKIKIFLKQYSFILYFSIFCLEASVQYMSYLFGFELYNLWTSDFANKLFSFLIVSWIFLFIFLNSTIYFFFKYFYEEQANDFYENSDSGIKGVFYWIFIGGIRNLVFGFAQYFLPQSENILIFKYVCLIGIQMIFLGPMLYFISGRRKFFIKKIRQWLMLCIGLLRIILILTFGFDFTISTKSNQGYLVSIVSNIYSIILFIYMSFWIASLMYEISMLIIEIFGHITFTHSIQKNNLKDQTNLIFFTSDENFQGKKQSIKKFDNLQQYMNNGKISQESINKIIRSVKIIRFEQKINEKQQNKKSLQAPKSIKRIKKAHTQYKTVLKINQKKESKLTFIK